MHKYNRAIVAHIGPMWGGKTSAMKSDLRKMQIAKYETCLFKPFKDDRYAMSSVVTHDGDSMEAINVNTFQDIVNYVEQNNHIKVIGIDEFQFIKLDKFNCTNISNCIYTIKDFIEWIIKNKYTLIISGLDLSSEFEPFENIKELLPYATHIEKHKAVCVDCGNDATMSYCFVTKQDKELIGGEESYKPLCLNCYLEKRKEDEECRVNYTQHTHQI